MNKKDKEIPKPESATKVESAKPESAKPALKQARWPNQGAGSGIKSAKSGHSQIATGRGAARGR